MRIARAFVSLGALVALSHASCTRSNSTLPGDNGGGNGPSDLGGAGGGGNGAGGGGAGGSGGGNPQSSCSGKMSQSLDSTWMLTVGTLNRTVYVHVPASYHPSQPWPLVLNFHGYTSNGMQQVMVTDMSKKADSASFIVAYPDGTGSPTGFNAGGCCGQAAQNMVDDIGFTKAILDEAESRLCVDAKRVFVTGFSNGAFMAQRIACELADRVAAIAPVSGMLLIPAASCKPARPISVMHFHGQMDNTVPYNGDPQRGWPSAPDSFAGWAMRDQCTDGTPAQTFNKGMTTCATYSHCAAGAEVTLCTIANGGHAWPGGPLGIFLPGTTNDIIANDAMWTFFEDHPLP